jgi:predicted NAD/FAD-binding protein
MTAAYTLAERHDVTLLEADSRLGGHTNTVDVRVGGEQLAVDTGFIVFNERTYPNFCRLLQELGVDSQKSDMSFSVRSEASGWEYCGSSLNGLFAQRRNLLRPAFYRMLREILRFNRAASQLLDLDDAAGPSLGDFLRLERFGPEFTGNYLLPMGAAIWSCPTGTFLDFPIAFVMTFFANHGLLQLTDRPVWKVVRGGSARYVEALLAQLPAEVRLQAPVHGIRRSADHVAIRSARGVESFDEVVLACHADQALHLLDDPSLVERQVLGAFPYAPNTAVLHTDAGWLPRRQRAWASWNYRVPADGATPPAVTYHMNRLQHLDTPRQYCVTLNPATPIATGAEIARFTYTHPIFSAARVEAQTQHAALIRRRRTSYCGAYWGYGFHEDGVRSALAVAAAFGEGLD